MNFKEKISSEIMVAMKAKDKARLNVLRYLKKLLIENETSAKPGSEQDVIIRYAKQIQDSLGLYPEGSEQRRELEAEVTVLAEFLPKPLTEDEVITLIKQIKNDHTEANFGVIMKALGPQIKGRFDGKKASDLVKGLI